MCVLAAAPALGISASAAAGISLATTAIGFGLQMYGQNQQAKAAAAQANYQAGVDRNNKIIADRQAEDAIKRGQAEEEDQRRKVAQIKGSQRTAFAARGIDLGSDVVIDTLSDTAMFGELDALTIRSNAEREAYGYRVQGMNYQASADNNALAAKNAKSAGRTNMMSTLLSGASTVSQNYADYKYKGVFK